MTMAESKQGRIFFLALILRSSKKQLLGGDRAARPATVHEVVDNQLKGRGGGGYSGI